MLGQAMDTFQVAKREHKDNVKAQYNDKKGANGAKEYFRASEMGSGDRKIIYSFFAHQLPKKSKSARNLRQLENGDFVHDRYQTAWEEMGVLISMEKRLTSKDDEYLAQFPWDWNGHYDGELDMNILRAHALGLAKVDSVLNEESGQYEIQVEIDEAYANAIGLFDSEGNVANDYEPNRMVADIKTMNPWGFKRIKEQGDVSEIAGYIDQIMFYMYMLNTPFGSIYIEAKDNNDIVEVQIVWKDLHDGVEYTFDSEIHGEQTDEQVRVVVDSGRFFGDATREGCVPRLNRLHAVKEALQKADAENNMEELAMLMPPRCSNKADSFPCSWGHKKGKIETCEYFDHCWSSAHSGAAVRPWEACPPEAIWEFGVEGETEELVQTVQIDSRKVPSGVTQEGFLALVDSGALDYTKFLVDAIEEIPVDDAADTAMHGAKHMFSETGELHLGAVPTPSEAEEYTNGGGDKAIKCTNCHHEITYQRLGNGGTKKCPFCQHTNKVIKL